MCRILWRNKTADSWGQFLSFVFFCLRMVALRFIDMDGRNRKFVAVFDFTSCSILFCFYLWASNGDFTFQSVWKPGTQAWGMDSENIQDHSRKHKNSSCKLNSDWKPETVKTVEYIQQMIQQMKETGRGM